MQGSRSRTVWARGHLAAWSGDFRVLKPGELSVLLCYHASSEL